MRATVIRAARSSGVQRKPRQSRAGSESTLVLVYEVEGVDEHGGPDDERERAEVVVRERDREVGELAVHERL